MNWRVWIYSLASAAIGGAASSLGGVVIAPSVFNFSHDGMLKIGQMAAFGAAVPVLALLKQTPLPVIQTTTHTLTETTTVNPAPPIPTEIKP